MKGSIRVVFSRSAAVMYASVQFQYKSQLSAVEIHYKSGNNLLFLHTNMEAGHGGASGRFDYLKEIALEYAFLLALEGTTE